MIVNSFHLAYIVIVGFVAIDVSIILLAFMLVEALRSVAQSLYSIKESLAIIATPSDKQPEK